MNEMPGHLAVKIILVALLCGFASALATLGFFLLQIDSQVHLSLGKMVELSIPGALLSLLIVTLIIVAYPVEKKNVK